MHIKRIKPIFILLLSALACGSPSERKEGMDRETKIKYDKYLIQGKELYATYCTNCHQDDGKGLAQLYPPLAASDYLMADISRAACIVKNGQFKEIQVNGVTYSQMMPGLQHLTNLEIAQILTYVTNSWGNDGGIQEVKAVENWLTTCETD